MIQNNFTCPNANADQNIQDKCNICKLLIIACLLDDQSVTMQS